MAKLIEYDLDDDALDCEEWRTIPGYKWEVSNHTRVRNEFSKYVARPFFHDYDIYVEVTNSEGIYVSLKLVDIMIIVFPKGK